MHNRNIKHRHFFIAGFVYILFACNTVREDNAEDKIKEILATERTAHLTKNDSLMTSVFADTTIQVNRGIVTFVPLQEARAKFSKYFHSADIIKWDDITAPVIRLSADKKMAFAIVQKQVIIKEAGPQNKMVYDTTDFAWISVFQKVNNKWQSVATVSTNK
jgi:hypothetical protein